MPRVLKVSYSCAVATTDVHMHACTAISTRATQHGNVSQCKLLLVM